MTQLDLATLREAVAGGAVAIRAITTLRPAGGPGTKVFPSTYGMLSTTSTKYAFEERNINGQVQHTVLLASVADQANRMELGLLNGLEDGDLSFPNPYVDFTADDDLADLGHLSALQAPHRLADAIFRDAMLDGTLFRLSAFGQAITDATPNNATALYCAAPHTLVFGMWDSTGPKGGLGSKFQRALVSEIVGEDAQKGVSVGSRIDPLQIARSAASVLQASDAAETWTLDESAAEKDKSGKPVKVGSKGELGRPSVINHGNVTPAIDSTAGGVTISRAIQSTVLSLAALRKLRFQTAADGTRLTGESRREAEIAARTALAALAIAAIAYQREQDYDLRSRCLLIPEEAPSLEILPRYGTEIQRYQLSAQNAASLLREAAEMAGKVGMGWPTTQVKLVPAPKLKELIRLSRAQLMSVDPGEKEED